MRVKHRLLSAFKNQRGAVAIHISITVMAILALLAFSFSHNQQTTSADTAKNFLHLQAQYAAESALADARQYIHNFHRDLRVRMQGSPTLTTGLTGTQLNTQLGANAPGVLLGSWTPADFGVSAGTDFEPSISTIGDMVSIATRTDSKIHIFKGISLKRAIPSTATWVIDHGTTVHAAALYENSNGRYLAVGSRDTSNSNKGKVTVYKYAASSGSWTLVDDSNLDANCELGNANTSIYSLVWYQDLVDSNMLHIVVGLKNDGTTSANKCLSDIRVKETVSNKVDAKLRFSDRSEATFSLLPGRGVALDFAGSGNKALLVATVAGDASNDSMIYFFLPGKSTTSGWAGPYDFVGTNSIGGSDRIRWKRIVIPTTQYTERKIAKYHKFNYNQSGSTITLVMTECGAVVRYNGRTAPPTRTAGKDIPRTQSRYWKNNTSINAASKCSATGTSGQTPTGDYANMVITRIQHYRKVGKDSDRAALSA